MHLWSSLRARRAMALCCASFTLSLGCDDAADGPSGAGGTPANAGTSTGGGLSGGAGSMSGGSAPSGGAGGSAVGGGPAGNGGASGGEPGGAAGTGGAGGGGGGTGGGGGGTGGAGGNAGSSGSAGSSTCDTLDKANDGSYVRSGWSAEYACSGGNCPAKSQADKGDVETNAFDGDYQSRWSTGVYQSALAQQSRFPLTFTVDLKKAVPVSKLSTHPGCKDYFDSPGTIGVSVSTDGTNFTSVTASPHTPAVPSNEACPPNASSVATDVITFPTTCARYVRLQGTQRTTSDRYWAIGDLKLYP
jgi:hypothetical protein